MSLQLKAPGPLEKHGNLSKNWKVFSAALSNFMIATEYDKKEDGIKIALLLSCVGTDWQETYEAFAYADGQDKTKFDTVLAKFKEHCDPRTNVVFERHVFFSTSQRADERVDSYVTTLRNLCSTCELGQLADELILTQLIRGLHDENLRLRLLKEDKLNLANAIVICRTADVSRMQAKQISAGESNPQTTANIAAIKKTKFKTKFRKHPPAAVQAEGPCPNCGTDHSEGRRCPASGKICNYCKKAGHFKSMCRKLEYKKKHGTPSSGKVHQVTEGDITCGTSDLPSSFTNLFLGSVGNEPSQPWTVGVTVNGKPLILKLDTGADCSVMSKQQYNMITSAPLRTCRSVLVGYPNTTLHPLGEVDLPIEYLGNKYQVTFKVVPDDSPTLLGRSDCQLLQVIQFTPRKDSVNEIGQRLSQADTIAAQLKYSYKDTFEGLGKLPFEYSIDIDPSVPPKVCPPRPVPVAIQDRVKQELDRLCQDGVIKPVDEYTPWVSNMVAVVSPNKVRLCIDPTHLNRAIHREQYLLHTLEEVVRQIPGAKYFAKYDASQGFYQIQLSESSSKLCTFATPFGRFRFTRMPYGIKSAPEIFQKVMDHVIQGLPKTFIVVDDVIQAADSLEELEQLSRQFLQRCREMNLKLNAKKFAFGLTELSYVGHVLTSEGLKPDPNKVKAMMEMPTPTNKEELQRVLGVATYLSKFIPNMSQVTAPMRKLLEKDVEFMWNKPQEESFNQLKHLITNAPVLTYFDVKKDCILSVDSSSYGVGAVLLQDGRPVAYASKSLTKAQTNYPQIEKEMLAICFGCDRFHQYIYGKSVVVESDHKPLEPIFKKQINQVPARLQLMLLKLSKYDLTVTWKPGKQLVIPDHLSRSPLKDELSDEYKVFLALEYKQTDLQEIATKTGEDQELSQVYDFVMNGWPSSVQGVPSEIRAYYHIRDEVTAMNGILFKGDRIVIPKSLRRHYLDEVHYAHLGITLTQARARETIF
jgi:hypothetical protein